MHRAVAYCSARCCLFWGGQHTLTHCRIAPFLCSAGVLAGAIPALVFSVGIWPRQELEIGTRTEHAPQAQGSNSQRDGKWLRGTWVTHRV